MDSKQIVKEFSFHGLYLRPDAFKLLTGMLKPLESTEAQEQLKTVVAKIIAILTDKNQILEKCYVELDMVKEALNANKETGNNHSDPKDVLGSSLVMLDNFSAKQQFYDLSSRVIKYNDQWVPAGDEPNSDHHRAKYAYLKYLIEKCDFTYQKSEKGKGKRLLHEIGSLKGQKGDFSVFGMICSKRGEFYLEDPMSSIKLLVDHSKLTLGYVTVGACLLVHGEMLDYVFKVKEFELPLLTGETEFPKAFPYLQTFYDKSSEDLRIVAETINAEVLDFAEYNRKYGEAGFITIVNNFMINRENVARLRTIFNRFTISKPAVLILCGRFTEYIDIGSYEELQCIKDNIDVLIKLFKEYQELVNDIEIFMVPEVCDLGVNTFPRGPVLRSPFEKLLQTYKNVHLTQNPCKLRFMDSNITISRVNYINKLVRNTIVPIDTDVEPSEHYIKTIFSQRDLIPGLLSDITVLKKHKNCTMIYNIPEYLVVCDDFLPPMEQELKASHNVVFPSNFNNTGTYVDIYPKRNLCDFKQA